MRFMSFLRFRCTALATVLLAAFVLAACLPGSASPAQADPAPQAVGSLTCDAWDEPREYTSVDDLLAQADSLGADSSVASVTIDLYCDWNTHAHGRIVVPKGKSYTVNLHGHVLDAHKAGTYGSPWYAEGEGEAVHVKDGGTLTVNGGTGQEAQTAHAGTLSDVYTDSDGNVTSAFWKFDGTGETVLYGGLVTGGACDDHYGAGGVSTEGEGCKVYLNDVTVAGNLTDRFDSSYGHGAGVAVHGKNSTLVLSNAHVVYNHAEGTGGGIYVRNGGCTVTLKNGSEVSHNLACYEGGGIMSDDSNFNLVVDASSVSYNQTFDDGGGIYFGGSLSLSSAYLTVANGSEISHNHSKENGGGIYTRTGLHAGIDASSVSYNWADGNEASDYYAGGGGIYLYAQSELELTGGAEVSHNRAWGGGGGIEVEQRSSIRLDNAHIDANCAYEGNGEVGEGGAIRYIHGSGSSASDSDVMALRLTNGSTISGNAADGRGGAISTFKFCLDVSSDGTGTISGNAVACTNSSSDARSGGGAIFSWGKSVSLSGLSISDNYSAYRGGGIYHFTGALSLDDVTINGNAAKEAAGGVWIGANLRCTLSGTIVVSGNWIKQDKDAAATSNSNLYINDSGGALLGSVSQDSRLGFSVGNYSGQSYKLTGDENIRVGLGDGWQDSVFSDDPAYSVAEWDTLLYLKHVASKYSLTLEWGSGNSASFEVAYGNAVSLEGGSYVHPGYGQAPTYWQATGMGATDRLDTDASGSVSFSMPGSDVVLRAVYEPSLSGVAITLDNSLTWAELEEHAQDAQYCLEHASVLGLYLYDSHGATYDLTQDYEQYISPSCLVESDGDAVKVLTYTFDVQPALLRLLGIDARYSGEVESFSARLISNNLAAVGAEQQAAQVTEEGGLSLTLSRSYREQCTVTLNPANGQVATDLKVAKGACARTPAVPAREGWVFQGWFQDGAQEAFDFSTPIDENLTLVAKWAVAMCTVTFDAANGTDPLEQQVTYGELAVRPDDPVWDGYVFLGWYTEDGQAYGFDTPVTGDMTLTAAWKDPLASPFFDVPADAWYFDWVVQASNLGLMSGYTDAFQVPTGYFGPDDSLTRGQVATVLWRIAGGPDAQGGESLSDVLPGRYYSRAVAWCVENGIVTGYLSGPYAGSFRPDAPVSREELAVMVYRFAAWAGVTTSDVPTENFERCIDTGRVSSWARDALVWCAAAEVITGKDTPEGLRLDPQEGATRAQAAKVFVRVQAIAAGTGQPYQPAIQADRPDDSGASAADVVLFGEEATFEDVEVVEPVESAGSAESVELATSAEPAESALPAAPAEPAESALPAAPVETTEPVEAETFDLAA